MSWSKKTSKILGLACVMSLFLAGCGDDSSNPSKVTANSTESSASKESSDKTTSSSKVPDAPQGADSALVALIDYNINPAKINLSVKPDTSGFYDIGEVYKAVSAESKIVFVLRHAERESDVGKESKLTAVGVQQAIDVGKKLSGGDKSFYYASTDYVRTRETALNIAKGRGESAEVVTWDAINGGYFLTISSDSLDELTSGRGGSLGYVAQWAFGDPFTNKYLREHGIADCFYDLFERGNQFVREVILANLPKWKRVNVLISHDLLLEPLAVYAAARNIDLNVEKTYHWINYVAGIAIIEDASGLVTLLPVRGTESGALNTREAYGNK